MHSITKHFKTCFPFYPPKVCSQVEAMEVCNDDPDHSHPIQPDGPESKIELGDREFAQILDFFFLSSVNSAENPDVLKDRNITHILNLTGPIKGTHEPRYPNKFPKKYNYLHLCISDEMDANISSHFENLHKFIDQGRVDGNKILVHCEAGISRSSTVVISYLMKKCRMSLKEAYEYVKAKKSNIGPNQAFFSQLNEYEKKLFGISESTYPIIDYLTDQLKNGAAQGFSDEQIKFALKCTKVDPNKVDPNKAALLLFKMFDCE